MKRAPLALAVLLTSASPSMAATHEYKGYSVTIVAHDIYYQTLSCTAGTLLSGGYSIDNYLDEPITAAAVILNAPISNDTWSVGFRNDGDTPLTIEFRIALLCE